MARADLLCDLIKSGLTGDEISFRKATEAISAEEREKQHEILAQKIDEMLKTYSRAPQLRKDVPFHSVSGNGVNLFQEKNPEKRLDQLILPDPVLQPCKELIEEQMRSDLLRSYGVEPRNKILLVGPPGNGKTHGASWGNAADTIRSALNLSGRAADNVHKWLGYGVPDCARVEECAKNRITLIGYGALSKDSAHQYSLPLPFDFHLGKMYRCLTVTLASFTPIKPTIQKYRAAQLWFTIDDGSKNLVSNRADASDKAVARGTLQHERFYNDAVVLWNEEESLKIKVNCREDAGDFEGAIPYALITTFEIAPEYNIDVYQIIIQKVQIEKVRQKEAITPN